MIKSPSRFPRPTINSAGHFPPERKGLGPRLRGEVGGEGRGLSDGLVFFFRFPREGGDPDPYTPPDRSWCILVLRQAQDEDEFTSANLSIFLMLSLSKHEEAVHPNPNQTRYRSRPPVFPAQPLILLATSRLSARVWVPAFAGKSGERAGA